MTQYVTRKVSVCTNGHNGFYTPQDIYACDHPGVTIETRYEARSIDITGDGSPVERRMYRRNGDVASFKSRSGARYFLYGA